MEISTLHPILDHEDIHPMKTIMNPTFPTLESLTHSTTISIGAKLGPIIEMSLSAY